MQNISKQAAHLDFVESVASSSEMSLQEPIAGKKPPVKKDKMTGGVNLKKSIAKNTKQKDTESNGMFEALYIAMKCHSRIKSQV